MGHFRQKSIEGCESVECGRGVLLGVVLAKHGLVFRVRDVPESKQQQQRGEQRCG